MKNKSWKYPLILALAVALFVWALQSAAAITLPKKGHEALLYSSRNRDDLSQVLQTAVASAKKSVLVLIYNFSDKALIHLLQKRADEGLDVRVVFDPKASKSLHKDIGNPIKLYPYTQKGLMHLKILVIDGELIFLGSANFSRQSFRMHHNLMAGFYSIDLADFIEEQTQALLKREDKAAGSFCSTVVGNQEIELWFTPSSAYPVKKIESLIDSAKKTARVAMFTWTRRDFAEALKKAQNRNVKTCVVMDRHASKGANRQISRFLKEENIPFRINRDSGLLHHKLMIIDDNILIHGSANWTKAAFTQNRDCFMIMYNLTADQKRKVENLWQVLLAESDAVNAVCK